VAQLWSLIAAMRVVIPFSIVLGLVWNALAVCLLGGKLTDSLRASWLLAGAIAGMIAGLFTIWSRRRRDGQESFLYGLATYYLAIFTYWVSFVVIERAWMCWQHGGWTDFDLRDHLIMIWIFLVYGTLWFGIILIPLSFLSRYVVWRLYQRFAA
jgi:hypothetical protein